MPITIAAAAGTPVAAGPLTLLPLWNRGPVAPPYLAGPAVADHLVEVFELDGRPAVGSVQVRNGAGAPVLLVGGELVVGARQDRTLNVSVLLPAGLATPVAVSCVEAGRWGGGDRFARSGRVAAPGLRAGTVEGVNRSVCERGDLHGDQAEVWRHVDGYADRLAADAPTAAFVDAVAGLEAAASGLAARVRPQPGQTGVAAVIDGRIAAVDLFDRPETLAAYWDGVVTGYAVDALGAPATAAMTDAEVRDTFADLVDRLLAAPAVEAPGAGLGATVHVSDGDLQASLLVVDGAVVHLAALVAG